MPSIDLAQTVVILVVLLFSLTIHEAAHAWSSSRLGDQTARTLGRVSLNPLVHIDPIGTIVFPLIAIATNVPVLGWAKPVPVDVRNLRGNWRQKYMVIAAAGPASNLVLAAAAAAILAVVPGGGQAGEALAVAEPVRALLVWGVVLNVFLAVFNMVPVPPLDGGTVAAGLLQGQLATVYDGLRPYGFFILYALMFSGILDRIVSPPAGFLLSLLL